MKTTITLVLSILISYVCLGNNIQVSNITLENANATTNTVQIEFDLSWENSWRLSSGPSNWDAAYLFVKFRVDGGPWNNARINLANFVAPVGSMIQVAPNSAGAFIYRDSDGSGNFDLQDVQLEWNYGANGVQDDAIIDIQVFAIEMVHIPQESFYVGGTGGTEAGKFYQHPSTNTSYQITSEAAISVGPTNGFLNYDSDGDGLGPIPAAYPKGFGAFYIMKYELTEGQWIGFFNSLSETQKANRDLTGESGKNTDLVVNGNTISWAGGSTNATTEVPDRACGYLSMGDMLAYMDWSGLRPITELEYEKSARGPVFPKAGEFAWGNANIFSTETYTYSNQGQPSENITNLGELTGNAAYSATTGSNGPVRSGIFAASATNKNREETGGSYYGVMELSGNHYERVVTVGTPRGRLFTGVHGNGIIGSTGNSTASNWPLFTTGDGGSYRGGGWINGADLLRVSDRFDGASLIPGSSSRIGIRAARTAF